MAYYELSRSSASLSKTYISREGSENFNFPLHFHTSYEILYVLDGEIEVVIDKSVYHPVKGEMVLVPPDKAHSYRTADYSVVSVVIFNTDFWKSEKKYDWEFSVIPSFQMLKSCLRSFVQIRTTTFFSNRYYTALPLFIQRMR